MQIPTTMSRDADQPSKFRKRTSAHNLRVNLDLANMRRSDKMEGCKGTESNFSSTRTRSKSASVLEGSYICISELSNEKIEQKAVQDACKPKTLKRKSSLAAENVKEEGRQLFETFVRYQMKNEGLDERVMEPKVKECFTPINRSPDKPVNPEWSRIGRELRELADSFSRTKERQRVKDRAHNVNYQRINRGQFFDLLHELTSQGGMTRERIIVLFFFCADLAFRALREQAVSLFCQLFQWSLQYIVDSVCEWVQTQGGWGAVLSSSFKSFQNILMVCGFIYLSFTLIRWISHK